MTYRDAFPERLDVFAKCSSAERASILGGQVACASCHAINELSDRTALPMSDAAFQLPTDDVAALRQLNAQACAWHVSPALYAMLGARYVLPERMHEALAIWQSLRALSQQGDVRASEDLMTLTELLAEFTLRRPYAALCEALHESAFDAAVLVSHKHERLGHLARAAIAKGDRARAQLYLAWMSPWPLDIDANTDVRIAAAALAMLDRDGRRVLALLGGQRDLIPIADRADALATVLRANAYELLGGVTTAARILRDLPGAWMLEYRVECFPTLELCAESGPIYAASPMQRRVSRAAPCATSVRVRVHVGAIVAFVGFVAMVLGLMSNDTPIWSLGTGIVFTALSALIAVNAHVTDERAARLPATGMPLATRVIAAHPTGIEIKVPEHQLAVLEEREARVRAKTQNLQEVIYES